MNVVNPVEIWKDIPNYEGLYKASTFGNIKSLNYNRTKQERVLIPNLDRYGYYTLSLSSNNSKKTKKIHKLIAITFINHIPSGNNLVINHKDLIKTNNKLENLEVVTNRENTNKKHIKSSSKYIGVCLEKKTKKWQAYIYIKTKKKHLGYFNTEEDASEAYKKELNNINKIEL